jgi:signal transduction histidine kinase/CheY-like chemotaxis protein
VNRFAIPVDAAAAANVLVEREGAFVPVPWEELADHAVMVDVGGREVACVVLERALATQQKLDSLGLVAGGIAHDFNNLLVGVLAESSAAREEPDLDESTRRALRRIEAAARRMAQLTRQLLAFAGRAQVVTTPIDADELLLETHDTLARMVRPELRLELTYGAHKTVIEGERGLLRQVVANLVANASDAAATRIEVSSRVIVHDATPCWQLEVADDGQGIDAAALPRIFEPFFTTKANRHGLGLSAVHGIVRRLGGDVEVETRAKQGTRFRVRIPVTQRVEVKRPRAGSEPTLPMTPLIGVRALVVDDEPSVRATVRRLLERRGATVVVAIDGLDAEQRLRDEEFQLVVSDVVMPGLTGYDVLAVARETQPNVCVVLMSGYTEKIRGDGSEEEPDAFIEKPFTAKALDVTIDEAFKR